MGPALLIGEYAAWHYGKALAEIIRLGRDFLRFGYDVFSITLLAATWISPFYRIKEGYADWTDFESIGETIIANTVSRGVGFLLRTFMIALGVLFESAIIAATAAACIIWIALPVIIPALFAQGINLLF